MTPLVRKLANDLGINLSTVKGTGVGGRIRREDIEALAYPILRHRISLNFRAEAEGITTDDVIKELLKK